MYKYYFSIKNIKYSIIKRNNVCDHTKDVNKTETVNVVNNILNHKILKK